MRRNISRSGSVRREKHDRYQIKNWVDRLPDVPCFVLGNAPSILDHDISLLENYFTIGINRAFKLIDPTVLLWQDASFWRTEYYNIHNLQALKVARDAADPRRLYFNFHLKGDYKFVNPKQSHILYGRGSSGPIAVQLAYALGCRPIVLLGMDCQTDNQGRGDFYGNNRFWLPHTLDSCQKGLEFIRKNCPVEIISCGNSPLWDRRELSDVLKSLKSKPLGRQQYIAQLSAF